MPFPQRDWKPHSQDAYLAAGVPSNKTPRKITSGAQRCALFLCHAPFGNRPMTVPRTVFAAIHELVCRVPAGKVATYGQISRYVAGSTPRIVGFAMAGVPKGSAIPWQRVINARGEISPHGGAEGSGRQREILEQEGIEFDLKGRVDLKVFGWDGPDDAWIAAHADLARLLARRDGNQW